MTKQIVNLSAFVLAVTLGTAAAFGQGITKKELDEAIEKAKQEVADQLKDRDEALLQGVADRIAKLKQELSLEFATRKDLDAAKSAQETTLKLLNDVAAAVSKLKKDIEASDGLTQTRLKENETAIGQLSRTDKGVRVLSDDTLKAVTDSPEFAKGVERVVPQAPPLPTEGTLIVHNETGGSQYLYVNGRGYWVQPGITEISVPIGNVSYRLGHESPRNRTIAAPAFQTTVTVRNQPQRIGHWHWDPFLAGWVWVAA